MVDLDPQLVALLALASAVVALLALGLSVVLLLRLRGLRREERRAYHGGSPEDLVGVVDRHDGELAAVRRDLATIHTNTEHLRELIRGTVSRLALIRYDAFDDMGGALSFSAALLDERGDGIVVSAINGRSETRCYAKPVVNGRSEHNLSREEEAAIASAVEGRSDIVLPPAGGRRRRRAS